MGGNWALFLVSWAAPWEDDAWSDSTGIVRPPWHPLGPSPSLGMKPDAKGAKAVQDLVKKIQATTSKTDRERTWYSINEGVPLARRLLVEYFKNAMARSSWKVTPIMRDMLSRTGLDHFGKLRMLEDSRDFGQVSCRHCVRVHHC